MLVVCPGCGVQCPSQGLDPDKRANASGECLVLKHDLSYYTLAHRDARFIHQHLVDAYGAQHVRQSKSTVGAAFSLAGLYLAVERGFTGRQVQLMHMRMANRSKTWPIFDESPRNGSMTVADVIAVGAGADRDQALMRWCSTVWGAWLSEQSRVRKMVDPFLQPEGAPSQLV